MDREISIQIPAFDTFVTEYSANISTTGMFIKSDEPLPPETEFAFELKVGEDWRIVRGEAAVVWCRYRHEGPDQPTGMGVRFTDLEPQSQRLISWIIEKHVRDGGKPFDVDALRGVSPKDLERKEASAASPGSGAGAPRAAARPRESPRPSRPRPHRAGGRAASAGPRFPLLSLIVAGFVVALLLGGLFWLSERSAQSAANPELPPDLTGSNEAATSETEGAQETAEPPTAPVFREAATRLVDGWSQAWSDQDADAYLAFYARDFEPPRGQSRSAWEDNRRQRLAAPEFIQISIAELEIEATGDARVSATFTQGYRSNTYEDSVRKTLELVREDGRWKILRESSGG